MPMPSRLERKESDRDSIASYATSVSMQGLADMDIVPPLRRAVSAPKRNPEPVSSPLPSVMQVFRSDAMRPDTDNAEAFEGSMLDGVPHGYGSCTYPSGARYEGQWENGRWHGPGVLHDGGGSSYTGLFVEGGASDKSGSWKYADGSSYKGGVVNGLRHGQGLYRHADTSSYSGGWEDDCRCGMGTEISADRLTKYIGMWRNDQRHGAGQLVTQACPEDGRAKSYIGTWQHGSLCGKTKMIQRGWSWHREKAKTMREQSRVADNAEARTSMGTPSTAQGTPSVNNGNSPAAPGISSAFSPLSNSSPP